MSLCVVSPFWLVGTLGSPALGSFSDAHLLHSLSIAIFGQGTQRPALHKCRLVPGQGRQDTPLWTPGGPSLRSPPSPGPRRSPGSWAAGSPHPDGCSWAPIGELQRIGSSSPGLSLLKGRSPLSVSDARELSFVHFTRVYCSSW